MPPDSSLSQPVDRICAVRGRRELGGDCWLLEVEWPQIAASARPAEFAMLRCGEGVTPLLRKPFSFADADPDRGTVSFLGRRVGPGTRFLGELVEGDSLSLLGPLGHGFNWSNDEKTLHVLIAGGIGIAPFPLLARRLAETGQKSVLLFGGRTPEDLVALDVFRSLQVDVRTIVQTGAGERTGLVTDLLGELLQESSGSRRVRAYSCGPTPMLRAVGRDLAAAGVSHQAALEEYMGCGFGVCIGCVVPVRKGEGVNYERSCIEGPVFEYERLAW